MVQDPFVRVDGDFGVAAPRKFSDTKLVALELRQFEVLGDLFSGGQHVDGTGGRPDERGGRFAIIT